jgi:uncharacterized tellurite resistance protein B-like protein
MSRLPGNFREAVGRFMDLTGSAKVAFWRELLGAQSLDKDYLTVADVLRDDAWLEDGMTSVLCLKKAHLSNLEEPGQGPADRLLQEMSWDQIPLSPPSNPQPPLLQTTQPLDVIRCRADLETRSLFAAIFGGQQPGKSAGRPCRQPGSEQEPLPVAVGRHMLPDLWDAVETASRRLQIHCPVSVFVSPRPGISAWSDTAPMPESDTGIRLFFGREAVHLLRGGGLEFLAGREIAATLFGIPLLEAATESPLHQVGGMFPGLRKCFFHRWKKAAGISADRAGFLACQDLRTSVQTILSVCTGVGPDHFGPDLEAATGELIQSCRGPRNSASGETPLWVRLNALREMAQWAGNDLTPRHAPEHLDDSIEEMLREALRKPPPGSINEALMEIVALGGVHVLSADREIQESEICRLLEILYEHFTDEPEHVVPMSSGQIAAPLEAAIERVRQEASEETKRFLMRLLGSIARADRELAPSEEKVLHELETFLRL